ncbi:MAG: hypothetical protein KatS3mg118_1336 [Paracoccaceae bacterium]|nr:MAG: hypothetical protein KatS3mg118_1336 [Paracoccaceae bacterium]
MLGIDVNVLLLLVFAAAIVVVLMRTARLSANARRDRAAGREDAGD